VERCLPGVHSRAHWPALPFRIASGAAGGDLSKRDRSGPRGCGGDAERPAGGGALQTDFEVTDNGEVQEIVHFGYREEPLDLVLLFDTSLSMKPVIERIAQAGKATLGELRAGGQPRVRDAGRQSGRAAQYPRTPRRGRRGALPESAAARPYRPYRPGNAVASTWPNEVVGLAINAAEQRPFLDKGQITIRPLRRLDGQIPYERVKFLGTPFKTSTPARSAGK
jgi:hypothetical protein